MKFFSHELAIDLGTANTVIFHKGLIALDEPSIVAIDTKTGDLIAVAFAIRKNVGNCQKRRRNKR